MAVVRRALVLLTLLASSALPGEAAAAEVVSTDEQGRQIRFDVRVEGADVEWHAAILRAAPHGDEIASVRIDVVSVQELAATCGREAAGCYSRDVIVVSADQSESNAHTLVHEYAHHLDRSRPVAGQFEPNGTSTWWRARGMEQLVRVGSAYRTYVRGWDRSIAEIFAEDYAQLARPGSPYGIRWLERPNETILAALRYDLGLGPEPEIAAAPPVRPLSISRRGTLAPRRSAAIPFGLLGPGRRVEATATVTGSTEHGARATLEIRCDGARVALRFLGTGATTVRIDRTGLGPAEECTATLRSTSRATRAYSLTLRLSIPAAG